MFTKTTKSVRIIGAAGLIITGILYSQPALSDYSAICVCEWHDMAGLKHTQESGLHCNNTVPQDWKEACENSCIDIMPADRKDYNAYCPTEALKLKKSRKK